MCCRRVISRERGKQCRRCPPFGAVIGGPPGRVVAFKQRDRQHCWTVLPEGEGFALDVDAVSSSPCRYTISIAVLPLLVPLTCPSNSRIDIRSPPATFQGTNGVGVACEHVTGRVGVSAACSDEVVQQVIRLSLDDLVDFNAPDVSCKGCVSHNPQSGVEAPLRSGFTSPIDSHASRSFRRIGKACHAAWTTHDALQTGGFESTLVVWGSRR